LLLGCVAAALDGITFAIAPAMSAIFCFDDPLSADIAHPTNNPKAPNAIATLLN
jgi:hypothetical protein